MRIRLVKRMHGTNALAYSFLGARKLCQVVWNVLQCMSLCLLEKLNQNARANDDDVVSHSFALLRYIVIVCQCCDGMQSSGSESLA